MFICLNFVIKVGGAHAERGARACSGVQGPFCLSEVQIRRKFAYFLLTCKLLKCHRHHYRLHRWSGAVPVRSVKSVMYIRSIRTYRVACSMPLCANSHLHLEDITYPVRQRK